MNQQFLPICLVHGVEDSQIPVLSADLAAESLGKTNTLTYLRLNGYGHDLDIADVQNTANRWLASVLFGQELLNDICIAQAVSLESTLLGDWRTDISHYILSRGKGRVYAESKGHKDTDGNESVSGGFGASKEFDNGVKVDVRGEANVRKDSNGDTKGEVKVEGRISKEF